MLVDPTISDHEFSEDMTSYWAREEELVERADVEGAAELTLSLFAEPHVRDVLRPMQPHEFERLVFPFLRG